MNANEFYHSFRIGFNWWFVLLPLQCILMIAFGASNARLSRKSNRIVRRDRKGTVANILAIAMDIILVVTVILESSSGILQVLDNHLGPEDDPIWSLIIFTFAIPMFAVLMYYAFLGASVFGREAKLMCLREIRRRRR